MRKKLLSLLALLLFVSMGAWAWTSGNCTVTLSAGVLTVSKTSGTGAMADYESASDQPWYGSRTSITSIVVGEGVTHIGNCAFRSCAKVTSISLPTSLTSIGDNAFNGCNNTALTSITIPDKVTTIGQSAFANCSKLTSVTIGNSVETIGNYAFQSCSSLTTVTIPDKVTTIGNCAFRLCNLTTVTLNGNPTIGINAFPSGAAFTMNLTANAAGGAYWATFCSSYGNFQADANTQVFQAELSGTELTLHEIADKIVNVGEGVILKSTGNPVMTLTTTDSSDEYLYNNLTGVSDPAGRDNDGCFYVLNYKAATGVGFYKLAASKTTLEYGKAFLWYDSSSSAPLRDYFEFLQDETTGIQQTEAEVAADYGTVYDLQGRPVTNPAPGIYIVNGKKVFIK